MWLGLGWAFALLALFFVAGLLLAGIEMQRISKAAAIHQASGAGSAGAIAGNIGLTAAGAILVAMPGFVSSIIGILLILPPTRALFRKVLAKKIRTGIENLGVRGFEAVNGYRTQASYGSFGDFGNGGTFPDASGHPSQNPQRPIIIDEEEIQEWSSSLKPEDFGTPDSDKDDKDNKKPGGDK